MKSSKILGLVLSCAVLCFAFTHAFDIFQHAGAHAAIIDFLKVALLGATGAHGATFCTTGTAANYYDSTLLGYQGRINPDYNKPELRELDTYVLTLGMENREFLMGITEINRIKESTLRPVYAYQFNRKNSTNGTSMTAFNTGIQGTSTQIPLTWIAFTEEFFTYDTTGYDNVEDFQMIYDNEMSQAQRNIRERLRTWLTGQLYAARTAYNPGGIKLANFNSSTDCWEISDTTKLWADMSSVMRQNKYGAYSYSLFADSTMYSNYEYSVAQGTMNAVNLGYQFYTNPAVAPATAPGSGRINNIWEDIILGNEVAIEPGYTSGTCLMMPDKISFAFMPWMPQIYIDGKGSYEDYAGGYGMTTDDSIAGLEYMVHGWRTQVDSSANHGFTQDSIVQWQIGVYVAYQSAVTSNAGESAIYQFAVVPA